MITSIDKFLSRSAKGMKRSAIREILKLLQKPGMISFAGGLPSPETFPVKDLEEIAIEVLREDGQNALQYGTTEGDPKLRKMLSERHKRQGLNVEAENIIITTGSQQALDLIEALVDHLGQVLCRIAILGGDGNLGLDAVGHRDAAGDILETVNRAAGQNFRRRNYDE